MRYGSVCSGIEAASVAWHPLGWRAAFLSEIEPFPRAVLAHHYPDTPLHGDFTTIGATEYDPIDVLVGGTPCQSFSLAGLRGGLDDDRGNLALEFLRLAHRTRPRWLVWENVPGVMSSNGGRDFGSILGGLGELGYGWAYRVLDAQFVRVDSHPRAVPQRRRRVFVVGYFGDWRRAAAVLFERESLSRNPAPRRKAGEGVADGAAHSLRGGGFDASEDETGTPLIPVANSGDVSYCLAASAQQSLDAETETLIAFSCKDHGADATTGAAPTLRAMGHDGSHANAGGQLAVAFDLNQITSAANRSIPRADVLHTMPATSCPPHLASPMAVRRLTPTECERLQGFPDGYTQVPYRGKPAADGPRYKALGNSMAVNVMRWIGQRIALVDSLE